MRCTICHHPQHQEIAVSLIRIGIRATARQFHISRASLDRHQKHLRQAIAKAQQALELSETYALLSKVEEVLSDARRIACISAVDIDGCTFVRAVKCGTESGP